MNWEDWILRICQDFARAALCLLLATVGVLESKVCAFQDVELLEENAVSDVVDGIAESLIRFETIGGLDRVEGKVVSQSGATGVVVSSDGYVISASFHFAHQPASIFATLPDGKKAAAEIVGRDFSRKLVLLKLDTDFRLKVPPALRRAEVRVGQTVIGVGKVLSSEYPSITTGIVSATQRIWGRAIQTDAKISPVNFGGPLLDLSGKVVGILVPMSPDDESEMAGTQWYDSGIGFAVPFDEILDRMDELKSGKTLRPGLVGIALKSSDIFAAGVQVAFCPGSSPAGKAGIQPDDQIVEINGTEIKRQADMKHVLGPLYEGDLASIKIIRNDVPKTFAVELVGEIENYIPVGLGMTVRRDRESGKIVVDHVIKGSPGESSGVEPDDVILRVAEKQVVDQESLRLAIAATEPGMEIALRVERNGSVRDLVAQVKRLKTEKHSGVGLVNIGRSSKTVRVKVPEFANRCFAVIPEVLKEVSDPALLVWVPSPGKVNRKQISEFWTDFSKTYNVVVLVPESSDEKKWTPDESEFIVAAVDRLRKQTQIDPNRIVVGGAKSGGAMAGLIAFSQRDLFRGLALIESSLSDRLGDVATSPVEPMVVMIGLSGEADESALSSIENLKESNFPVYVDNQADIEIGNPISRQWAESVLQWLVTVDAI